MGFKTLAVRIHPDDELLIKAAAFKVTGLRLLDICKRSDWDSMTIMAERRVVWNPKQDEVAPVGQAYRLAAKRKGERWDEFTHKLQDFYALLRHRHVQDDDVGMDEYTRALAETYAWSYWLWGEFMELKAEAPVIKTAKTTEKYFG